MEKEDDLHKCCSLCMDPLKGKRPKVLPCLHTFCSECISKLIVKATKEGALDDGREDEEGEKEGQAEGKKKEEKARFPCPTCRRPVPIMKGGVDAYMVMSFIIFLTFLLSS